MYASSVSKEKRKLTEEVTLFRFLLLGSAIVYALSFVADILLNLELKSFIISSAAISFLLFAAFILSFFLNGLSQNISFATFGFGAAIMFQLIGLSVVNQFRFEILLAISCSVLIAGFIFNIKTLLLFDVIVCTLLTAGIYLDRYISEQLSKQHIQVLYPHMDPMQFFLVVAGAMAFAITIHLIVAATSKKLKALRSKRPSLDSLDEAILLLNAFNQTVADCNEAAVKLFEAADKSLIVGIPFESLTVDIIDLYKIREHPLSKITGFITLEGRKFQGVFHSKTEEAEIIRVTVFEVMEEDTLFPASNLAEGIRSSSDQLQKIPLLDQNVLPIACIGVDYQFIKVNQAFCELTGYTQKELKGIKLTDLVHYSDKEKEKNILSNLFSGRIPINRSEKRLIRKNKQVIWINTSSTLQRDDKGYPQFVFSVIENINRQKRQQLELIKDKSNLASLVDNSDSYIFNVDSNHTLLFLNEKLKDFLFGLTDIVIETGFNLKQIIPPSYLSLYETISNRGMKGESFTIDIAIGAGTTSKTDVEVSINPIADEANRVITLLFSIKDISERKKKERELLKQKEEAEASREAKSSFLATMSHEIRTPLNGVIGMSKLLDQTTLTPKQQEYLNSIILSGEALLSVINDILDFSKIESAKMELEKKPFALKRCVEETFELMSAKAIEKNIALQLSIQKDVPRFIIGDITRLRQVLLNLVSNGIKFTQQGKLQIHITKLKEEKGQIELLFEIIDTGIGIPPERLARLFKSFSQVEVSTASTYGGSGLGLAISKNLVSLMGGKIWVKSTPGAGSTFFFTLKTRPATTDEITGGSYAANQLTNASVLIISDDKEEINIYTDYFKRWGMKVKATDNTNIAIQWISEKGGINLVAIDAQMITIKALTIAEQLRKFAPKEELPMILFNAADVDITIEFTDKLLSAVIPKNIDRSKLLDMLISVFAIEAHQRNRLKRDLDTSIGKKLSREIPLNILIAEDNNINQKLVINIFDGLGYKPDITENGLQVIEKLKMNNYDIIFMDVQMPEMDGLETTRYIINKMNLSKRPIIVAMTAFALEGDREKCLNAGMDDYISKPFMIEEIIEKIKKWGKGKNVDSNQASVGQNPTSRASSGQLINLSALGRLKALTATNPDEFIRDVIKMYLRQAPSIVDDIIRFHNEKKYAEMGQSAHKLKGSSLNLGAQALAEICRQLEIKGKNNDPSGTDSLIKDLKETLERTVTELNKI